MGPVVMVALIRNEWSFRDISRDGMASLGRCLFPMMIQSSLSIGDHPSHFVFCRQPVLWPIQMMVPMSRVIRTSWQEHVGKWQVGNCPLVQIRYLNLPHGVDEMGVAICAKHLVPSWPTPMPMLIWRRNPTSMRLFVSCARSCYENQMRFPPIGIKPSCRLSPRTNARVSCRVCVISETVWGYPETCHLPLADNYELISIGPLISYNKCTI
mmetsp:Transcript_23816/g.43024  ORF Transcript_23816/g.43024 Transcript_23816/m.43024 type:complete len:211 (+) Transcript_23816:1225-1857(+)